MLVFFILINISFDFWEVTVVLLFSAIYRCFMGNLHFYLKQVYDKGHLLYWGKVTVIYPICESNIYVLSSKLPTPIPKLLQAK